MLRIQAPIHKIVAYELDPPRSYNSMKNVNADDKFNSTILAVKLLPTTSLHTDWRKNANCVNLTGAKQDSNIWNTNHYTGGKLSQITCCKLSILSTSPGKLYCGNSGPATFSIAAVYINLIYNGRSINRTTSPWEASIYGLNVKEVNGPNGLFE